LNPERFARLKELLLAVADLPAAERSAYLDAACRDDPAMRREVEATLAHDLDTRAILKTDNMPATQFRAEREPGWLVGQTVAHYEVLAVVGAGGMGVVYRARDLRLGRDVALKVISPALSGHPDRVRRFEQEARAAGALAHPNVVAIYDVGTHNGRPFVVMEFLAGESLRDRLARGRLPVRKALDHAAQAARGLAAAHERGIVHRDVKPENLFVTRDGRVKVLDFGIAKLVRPVAEGGATDGEPVLTEIGAVVGTVGYMSPEQVRGLPADHRSDLFALGAILYEMLTGRRAFQGDSSVETQHAILKDDPPPLTAALGDIPLALERVVRRCLEKSPEERFQSARDLAFDLEALAAGAPSAVARPRKLPRRRLVLAVGLGLLLAAAALAALAHSRGWSLGGGAGAAVAYDRLSVQRGRIYGARFSPDGNTVFFSAAWDGQPMEIYEVRPGFPNSRPVGLPAMNILAVSKNGQLAVSFGDVDNFQGSNWGTVAEVPMSGGVPRRILDGVMWADWSADGTTLAVSHWTGDQVALEMPPGHVLYRTAAWIRFLCVAPSGKWFAFAENPAGPDTRGSVVILDAAGREVARTREWNHISGVAWAANGREVWFSACDDSRATDLVGLRPGGRERLIQRHPGRIALHDIAGGGAVLLVREHVQVGIRGASRGAEERELGWMDWPNATDISADGRTLLFSEQMIAGGPFYSVCLRGMDGGPAVRLGEGAPQALSPDDRWVATVRFGTPQRLFLLPTGAGDSTALRPDGVERYVSADWLPDGSALVFGGAARDRGFRVFRQEIAGGEPVPLTAEGFFPGAVSPDGRFVVATRRSRTGQGLYACPVVAGGEPEFVADLSLAEFPLQWTADGEGIYVGQSGPRLTVTRIERATGKREPWRVFAPPDPAGILVLNAVLTPDGTSYAYNYFRWLDDLYQVAGLQ
jgi:serine/threonine protein kinase